MNLDDGRQVRVKDSVSSSVGWHLWMSLWDGDEMVATSDDAPEIVTPDIADATLVQAAHQFVRSLKGY